LTKSKNSKGSQETHVCHVLPNLIKAVNPISELETLSILMS